MHEWAKFASEIRGGHTLKLEQDITGHRDLHILSITRGGLDRSRCSTLSYMAQKLCQSVPKR